MDNKKLHPFKDNEFPLNQEQKEIITNYLSILQNFKENVLQDPLLKGIPFDIGIAGGAIRDLVLNNIDYIKDIDIIVSPILCPSWLHPDESNYFIDRIKKSCQDLKLLNEDKKYTDYDYFSLLFSHVVSKNYNVYQKHDDNLPKEIDAFALSYESDCIISVLKAKHSDIKYDIDIISVNTGVDSFVEQYFDYGLCKAILKPSEKEYIKMYGHDSIHNFLENNLQGILILKPDFISDYLSKTLTYIVSDLTDEKIKRSLFGHLGRILKKYPDFSVELINHKPEHADLLTAALSYHRLNSELKDTSSPVKRNKI